MHEEQPPKIGDAADGPPATGQGCKGNELNSIVAGEAAKSSKRSATPCSLKLCKPPVVAFVSLGCAKNLVDSEKMLGQLVESGALLTGDEGRADTVVVNTCGFLESSRREAIEVIGELAERKRRGKLKRIVVAGCLVQRDGQKLLDAAPGIDALVGVNNRDDVVRAVWRMDRDEGTNLYLGDYHPQAWNDQTRLRLTPRHYAYVRISEGCNQKCTFCTIPSIRGPMHCKTPEELVAECRELIADGARELLLIGQDTTSYGEDIGYQLGLAGLLRKLNAELDGVRWIRQMYVYPSVFTDAMIDALAESAKIVKYIDMPLQHINDRVLKGMHRRVTRKQTEELLEKLRKRIAGVTIRTTFIVGFPGETEEEFAELVQFVKEQRFDAAGAFKYSLEAETPSGRMKNQVDEQLKQERYERLMLAQQEIAFARAREMEGMSFEVVIDSDRPARAADEAEGDDHGGVGGALNKGARADSNGGGSGRKSGKFYPARHAGQAPEVDSICRIPVRGAMAFEPGEVVPVRCIGAAGYDLTVEPARTKLTLVK